MASAERPNLRVLGPVTVTAVVVASMIGTGIFTTTGLMAADLRDVRALGLVWLVGGLLALCGALCYGELAAALPRSGGEYHFLSQIYHPCVGFVAGWITLVVGFSAPIAFCALAFGEYLQAVFPSVAPIPAAGVLIVGASVLHAWDVRRGSSVQNVLVLLKLAVIVIFLVAASVFGSKVQPQAADAWSTVHAVGSPAFAVSLVFASFAYSGWNTAAYIAGEVRDPQRTLPRALLTGTAIVVVLYLLLNVAYFYAAPLDDLAGVFAVGHLAAVRLLGPSAGRWFSMAIALSLVSTVTTWVMVGPRVYETVGQDYPLFRRLAQRSRRGTPLAAIVLQAGLALLMLLAAPAELLTYIGFTLTLSTALTVAGVIVLRRRLPQLPRPYRTWGYPVTPALYLLLSVWMLFHALSVRPKGSLAGLATLAIGALFYRAATRRKPGPRREVGY